MTFVVGGSEKCKKRWRDLRDTYGAKKRARNVTQPSGSKRRKTKPWKWEEQLSFLDDHMHRRKEARLFLYRNLTFFVTYHMLSVRRVTIQL
jgi:hypothetical protein